MSRFRKKIALVDAIQVPLATDHNHRPAWVLSAIEAGRLWVLAHYSVRLKTENGTVVAKHGDWIVRQFNDEISMCDNETFSATYEPA